MESTEIHPAVTIQRQVLNRWIKRRCMHVQHSTEPKKHIDNVTRHMFMILWRYRREHQTECFIPTLYGHQSCRSAGGSTMIIIHHRQRQDTNTPYLRRNAQVHYQVLIIGDGRGYFQHIIRQHNTTENPTHRTYVNHLPQ